MYYRDFSALYGAAIPLAPLGFEVDLLKDCVYAEYRPFLRGEHRPRYKSRKLFMNVSAAPFPSPPLTLPPLSIHRGPRPAGGGLYGSLHVAAMERGPPPSRSSSVDVGRPIYINEEAHADIQGLARPVPPKRDLDV